MFSCLTRPVKEVPNRTLTPFFVVPNFKLVTESLRSKCLPHCDFHWRILEHPSGAALAVIGHQKAGVDGVATPIALIETCLLCALRRCHLQGHPNLTNKGSRRLTRGNRGESIPFQRCTLCFFSGFPLELPPRTPSGAFPPCGRGQSDPHPVVRYVPKQSPSPLDSVTAVHLLFGGDVGEVPGPQNKREDPGTRRRSNFSFEILQFLYLKSVQDPDPFFFSPRLLPTHTDSVNEALFCSSSRSSRGIGVFQRG